MNTTEKILAMEASGELEEAVSQACAKEVYRQAELQLADILREKLRGEIVHCKAHGSGMVTEVIGDTFEFVIVVIDFVEVAKKFSLFHIMNNKFITFDNTEIPEFWEKLHELHLTFTSDYHKSEADAREAQRKAEKLEKKKQKAEAKNKQSGEQVNKDTE